MPGIGNYEIAVSAGWWGIAKAQELLGLAQKAASVATYGVNYVQVDFENTSEFFEPDVIERLRQVVDDLQIRWGAHGEIGEFMGWEGAIEVIWKQSHRRLHQYLDGIYDFFIKYKGQKAGADYSKYKPDYINYHASNMPPIGLFVERFRYAGHIMLTLDGKENWDDFIRPHKGLYDWFTKSILFHIFARESGVVYYNKKDVVRTAADRLFRKKVKQGEINIAGLSQEEVEKKELEFIEKYDAEYDKDPQITKEIQDFLYETWLEMSSLRNVRGAITIEEWAYAIVGKYLELEKDNSNEPLWKMFFGNKNLVDLEKEWSSFGQPPKEIKLFDDVKGVVNLMPEFTAMVACRYIIGHFKQTNLAEFIIEKKRRVTEIEKRDWDKFYELPAHEKLKKIKVIFSFENPEIIEGQREGLQRIIHARHIYYLVKAAEKMLETNLFRVWFDSEHYVHNGLDPVVEIKTSPDDFGEYTFGFHVGAPKPYHPAHEPIDVGSEAQRWIYIYSYHLRKKGFGLKDKGIIMFERGGARGGQAPINFVAQSATSIRLIVEELKKETPPEKLPLSFFGVSPEGFVSPERQIAMMKEHYWDPLKGMLVVPEEEYTFLSKSAIEKGKKPEEFKKEELR